MPTRRLFVALTVLLLGVLGVGLVTALSRYADDRTPTAAPSPTAPASVPPLATVDPSPEPDATTEPTAAPTTPPGGTGTPRTPGTGGAPGQGSGSGGGAKPNMPNTGVPAALALAGTVALGAAVAARRATR